MDVAATVIDVGNVFPIGGNPGVTIAIDQGGKVSIPVTEDVARVFATALYVKNGVTLTISLSREWSPK